MNKIIKLEIGEIVLHDFDVTNLTGLDKTIETELSAMLSRSGLLSRSTALKNMELKNIKEVHHLIRTTQARRDTHLLGTNIATLIHSNLERRANQR